RKALFAEEGAGWGTPVIYLRSGDGQLFDIQARPSLTSASAAPGAPAQPVPASRAVSASLPSPTPVQIEAELEDGPERELEPAGGPVPIDSPYYVRRPADEIFETAARRRDGTILVKGARQMGKTSLLARGLAEAGKPGRNGEPETR